MGISKFGLVAFGLLTALTLSGGFLWWGNDSVSARCGKMKEKCRANWGECFSRYGSNGDACCPEGSALKCVDQMTRQEAMSKDPTYAKMINCILADHPDLESLEKCLPNSSECKNPNMCQWFDEGEKAEFAKCPKWLNCYLRKHSDWDALMRCLPRGSLSREECDPANLTPCEKMMENCTDKWGECFPRDGSNGDACCPAGSAWKCVNNMGMDEAMSKDPGGYGKKINCLLAGHPDWESLEKCMPKPSECKSPGMCRGFVGEVRAEFEKCPRYFKCLQRKHSNFDALLMCWPRHKSKEECNAPLHPIENATDDSFAPEELTPCLKMTTKCTDNWGECFPRDGSNGDACCPEGSALKCGNDMTVTEIFTRDPIAAQLINCFLAGHPDLPRRLKCLQRKHSDIQSLNKCLPNLDNEEECNAALPSIENVTEA
uniref:Uncharacterized protein n=1 Tax=Globodera rostochiensis TaxID=31243 RepID=A0A914HJD2_GLORO